jgi:hypothetical protein
MVPARYSGGDGARPRPDPASVRMSGRSALARGAAVVAVFAVSFAVGSALGEDERPAARHAPARQATTTELGPLRLEAAPALPALRAVPVRPKPKPAPAAPAGTGPAAPVEPVAESAVVPAETGGNAAPTPTPPVSSPAPAEPTPVAPAPRAPAPPSEPPPSSIDVPVSSAPAPDPAPAPAPVPMPDPSPSGGSGQYDGP